MGAVCPLSGQKRTSAMAQCASLLLRPTRAVSQSSRRLDAERLGDGGDLGALTLDRGDELLCAAARWRLRGRIELVIDRLVVGHRDDVGTDALTQVRRQRLASEQADIAAHF